LLGFFWVVFLNIGDAAKLAKRDSFPSLKVTNFLIIGYLETDKFWRWSGGELLISLVDELLFELGDF
jgi:hypothetical protein